MKNPNAPRPETIECDIIINHSEAIFDIRNITHKIGRAHFNGDNMMNVSVIQADDSPQDMAIMERSLERRIADIEAKVVRYSRGRKTTEELDAVGRPSRTTTISLAMPDNWQEHSKLNLETAVYNYVVNMCVSDFLANVNTGEAALYAEKADMELDQVKYYVSTRKPGTMRRHRHFVG